MAVYLFDPDVLFRLAELEGDEWLRTQEADPESPYGIHAWKRAWETRQELIQSNPEYSDELVSGLVEGGDGAIYGAGGWRRYVVALDGELVLLGWSATPDACSRAEAMGIRVA